METSVKLSDIVEALEMQSDESTYYLDNRTGTVYLLSPDELYAGEEDDPLEDYPEWQRKLIEISRRLANGEDENLFELPTRWDVNEYGIMEAFCDRQDPANRDTLNGAIKGKGAFRRFKDTLAELDLFDQWNQFRRANLKDMAFEWCRDNEIAYVDDIKD